MTNVYVSIGNSDDKLTQKRWHQFVDAVADAIQKTAEYPGAAIHGEWYSPTAAPWQNACWCLQLPTDPLAVDALRTWLRHLAGQYGQDSIAWAEAPVTEFLTPSTEAHGG